jgi:putative ABC transport system permease protein
VKENPMEALLQDLRYGARMLARNPGFALVAIVSLALGIGANTAIFSVINATLLRALPYPDPDRIVLVWGDARGRDQHRNQVSFTDTVDWRAQSTTLEELAAYDSWTPLFSGAAESVGEPFGEPFGEPERVPAALVADGFLPLMGGQPILGRGFLPEEQQDGSDAVVVLGHAFWQRKFAGDPGVVGRTLTLNGRPHTVVGVLPADFRSLPAGLLHAPAELYRPLGETYDDKLRSSRHMRAIARLEPGVTLEQAQTEMRVIAERLEQEHPTTNAGYGVNLVTLREDLVGGVRPALLMLFGAVGLVLLIACANVASLLLARTSARQREIAIRAALGASRGRLVRQALTESVLLSLVGGALGLLFALWGVGAIELLGSTVLPFNEGLHIDLGVLGFTLATSLLTGVLFGLAPAVRSASPDLNVSLKEGGRWAGGGPGRLRNALVVAEIAMALVLLVSAGLLVKSIGRLQLVDPGFDPTNALTMNVWLPAANYPDGPSRAAFYDRLVERVERLPGVRSAGVVSTLPGGGGFDRLGIEVEGQPKPPGEAFDVDRYIVSPGYLNAMRIPILGGRPFTNRDAQDTPLVVLVSATMAQSLWPGEDAIGKRVRGLGSGPGDVQPWREVVGVVGDVKQYGLDTSGTMQLYFPQAQRPTAFMTLVARTESDPASMVAPVRNEILAVDAGQAAFDIATLEQVLAESIARRRFAMLLLGAFALVALVLASVGTYGVISHAVTQRTREIGVRMALGAQPGDVLRLVVGEGAVLALTGVAVGAVGALAATRLLSSLLFEVSATDPATFVGTALLLMGIGVVACYIPARRAARVDPTVALRYE